MSSMPPQLSQRIPREQSFIATSGLSTDPSFFLVYPYGTHPSLYSHIQGNDSTGISLKRLTQVLQPSSVLSTHSASPDSRSKCLWGSMNVYLSLWYRRLTAIPSLISLMSGCALNTPESTGAAARGAMATGCCICVPVSVSVSTFVSTSVSVLVSVLVSVSVKDSPVRDSYKCSAEVTRVCIFQQWIRRVSCIILSVVDIAKH